MAKSHPAIPDEQASLIRSAPLFFVATTDPALAESPLAAMLLVVTRCGYGVPVMDFVRHRATADRGRR